MDIQHAKQLIRDHEGVRYTVYVDTTGNRTIGVGCNLERSDSRARIKALGVDFDQLLAGKIALTEAQVDSLFEEDFQMACSLGMKHVANFNEHPDPIQSVITDMNFNLGNKFAQFTGTIAGFVAKDYKAAADNMQDSLWYEQTKTRAVNDVSIVRAHI